MIKEVLGKSPKIDETCFVAHSADIVGDVTLEKNVNVWYITALRGDIAPITIGENSNIQEGSVVHTSVGFPTTIGKNVTIGHKALVHGCTIGDNTLIGMGAIILDGAKVGSNSILAAGSLVPPGKEIPDGVMAMGSPAKVVRELSEEEKQGLLQSAINYVEYAKNHK